MRKTRPDKTLQRIPRSRDSEAATAPHKLWDYASEVKLDSCQATLNIAMRILSLIPLLLLLGCSPKSTSRVKISADTNTTSAIETPSVAATTKQRLPTWYVFKIKALHKVTHSDDRSLTIVEGVTMKDKEFKVKLVWDEPFKQSHPRAIDQWLKKSKADFEAGIPYVIAGGVISRDPLTVKPDTLASHAPNFGAPPENVY